MSEADIHLFAMRLKENLCQGSAPDDDCDVRIRDWNWRSDTDSNSLACSCVLVLVLVLVGDKRVVEPEFRIDVEWFVWVKGARHAGERSGVIIGNARSDLTTCEVLFKPALVRAYDLRSAMRFQCSCPGKLASA